MGVRRRRLCVGADGAESGDRGADVDELADVDQELLDDAVVPDLDVDVGLLGFDDGHQVAAMDGVAGGHPPFDDATLVHVGAERRHRVVEGAVAAHGCTPTRVVAAEVMSPTWGIAAVSRCFA